MKYIIFLLLFCFAFSCKTTKTKTEFQTGTNTASKLDVSASSASMVVKRSEAKTIDKSTSKKVTTWEANTKVFSAPDSTGKQHLQSETNTKGQTVEGEQKNMESSKKDSVGSSNKSDVVDKSKIKASTKAKAKENKKEEIKSPAWFNWTALVWLVLGCGLVFVLLKKYKIL